jgi:hypothetical protein
VQKLLSKLLELLSRALGLVLPEASTLSSKAERVFCGGLKRG